MIDKLVLSIPFKSEHCVLDDEHSKGVIDLSKLARAGIKMTGDIHYSPDGTFCVESLQHPFESLPSSYASMAMKIYSNNATYPHVEIKCSPAKLLQGHNVYGPDCPRLCGFEMLALLSASYPSLYEMLHVSFTEIREIDCTFSSRANTQEECDQFIQATSNISNGQTKAREGYATTSYFGAKNSRLKRLKIYSKLHEVFNQVADLKRGNTLGKNDKLLNVNSDPALHEYARGLIRFEANIRYRFLKRRGIPTNFFNFCTYANEFASEHGKSLVRYLFERAFADVFSTFGDVEMTVYNDEQLQDRLKSRYTKINTKGQKNHRAALAAFRTYRNIRSEGWKSVLDTMSSSTFYRHIEMLLGAGVSKAWLQNLQSARQNNVVPMVRFIDIDFSDQHPANYVEPVSQFSQLRLAS